MWYTGVYTGVVSVRPHTHPLELLLFKYPHNSKQLPQYNLIKISMTFFIEIEKVSGAIVDYKHPK